MSMVAKTRFGLPRDERNSWCGLRIGAEITRLSSPMSEPVTLPAARFAESLRQVVRAALTDDSRAPQLTGVLMVATTPVFVL